jgi:hypothetical protein
LKGKPPATVNDGGRRLAEGHIVSIGATQPKLLHQIKCRMLPHAVEICRVQDGNASQPIKPTMYSVNSYQLFRV